jgi:hypothetical protein
MNENEKDQVLRVPPDIAYKVQLAENRINVLVDELRAMGEVSPFKDYLKTILIYKSMVLKLCQQLDANCMREFEKGYHAAEKEILCMHRNPYNF